MIARSFLVDIMNPCWLWRGADLSQGAALVADVGQFPFNFQIGHERDKILLRPPATDAGELEVRAGDCDGAVIASLSLAPALDEDGRHPPADGPDRAARRQARPVFYVHGLAASTRCGPSIASNCVHRQAGLAMTGEAGKLVLLAPLAGWCTAAR